MFANENVYLFDDVTVDYKNNRVQKDERTVTLTPLAFNVLMFLLKNSGRIIEKQELFENIWKETFVSDNALARIIREIRQALNDDASHPRYIETVPKRGYRFIADIEERFSYDTSPPKIEKISLPNGIVEKDDESGKRINKPKRHLPISPFVFSKSTLTLSAFGMISILFIGAWFLYRQKPAETSPAPIRSIAVLPLKNLTGEETNDYLSDGVTESLITSLSKIEGLTVIARSSAFAYKDKEIDLSEVGQNLKAEAVLIGSVQKEDDSLRVNVRLVSTADGRVLWAKEIYKPTSDIFALQDEIARNVVVKLKPQFNKKDEQNVAHRYTNSPEAYQLYLRGRYYQGKRTGKDAEKSINYFQQAVNLDSGYALAYAGLADSYYSLSEFYIYPAKEVIPKAKASVERALELDETLAEAHASLGHILHYYDWDRSNAEREFKRAIELDPNSVIAHQYYSYYLMDIGRFDEALKEIERALELDPLSLWINRDVGIILYYSRQYDQAIKQFQKTLELDTNFQTTYVWLERSYEAKGLYEQAVTSFLKRFSSEKLPGLKDAYVRAGWKGYWQKRLEIANEQAKSKHVDPYNFVQIYARLKEKDQVFAWLQKSFEERSAWMTSIKNDPLLDDFHEDARFQDLLRRIELLDP